MDPNLFEKYQSHFRPLNLKSGAFYVQEGQVAKSIAYVKSGLLRSFQINQKAELITTDFFDQGDFCGSFYSFYEQKPSFETIEAIGEVELLRIGFETLHELYEKDFLVNQVGRQMIQNVCIRKDIRISKLLKLSARDRYLWFLNDYPQIAEKAPLKHIASFLGMKPESLSRVRKNLIS